MLDFTIEHEVSKNGNYQAYTIIPKDGRRDIVSILIDPLCRQWVSFRNSTNNCFTLQSV